MDSTATLELFEKKSGGQNNKDVSVELVTALEYIPLAIVQATAYISQRVPRYSVSRYLEDFQKNDRKQTSLLNHEDRHLRRDWEAKNDTCDDTEPRCGARARRAAVRCHYARIYGQSRSSSTV